MSYIMVPTQQYHILYMWAHPAILHIIYGGPTQQYRILYMYVAGPPSNIAYYIQRAHPAISHIIYGGPTQQYRILYMVGPPSNIAYYSSGSDAVEASLASAIPQKNLTSRRFEVQNLVLYSRGKFYAMYRLGETSNDPLCPWATCIHSLLP